MNGQYTGSDWGSTDTAFEISSDASTYGVDANGHGKFAEMNFLESAILFQDLPSTPGDIIEWKLDHGYANADDLLELNITAIDGTNSWKTAKGVYIIPAEQTKTRFAFISLKPAGSCGNILDNIVFSTLLGNLNAVQNDDQSATITGYWGSGW